MHIHITATICEIKLQFKCTIGGRDVYWSGYDSNNIVNVVEHDERYLKYAGSVWDSFFTNIASGGRIVYLTDANDNNVLLTIIVIKSIYRNSYRVLGSYCWANVGQSKIDVSGFFASSILNRVQIGITTGTLTGSYSTVNYY